MNHYKITLGGHCVDVVMPSLPEAVAAWRSGLALGEPANETGFNDEEPDSIVLVTRNVNYSVMDSDAG